MNGETINPIIRVVLGLVVIAIAFYYVIHRSKLESERFEKGEKLLELKASMSNDKSLRLDLLSLSFLFLIAIGITILNWLAGKSIEVWILLSGSIFRHLLFLGS